MRYTILLSVVLIIGGFFLDRLNNVYTIAMGDGYKYRNTIENKVSGRTLRNYIRDTEINNKINNSEKIGYSIWGLSSKNMYEMLSEGDIAFFTYKNTLVYIAVIECKFECNKELGELLWGESTKWNKKVLFKDVFKLFIPDSKKKIEQAYMHREDIKPSNVKNIEKLHINNNGFREILGIEHGANLQSFNQQKDTYDNIMSRYAEYCLLSNFECLIREV